MNLGNFMQAQGMYLCFCGFVQKMNDKIDACSLYQSRRY